MRTKTVFWISPKGKVMQRCVTIPSRQQKMASWVLSACLAIGMVGLVLSWFAIRLVEKV